MKLLILGATGRTGKLVVEEALQSGYQVCCLIRTPQKVKKRDVIIYQGNPANREDLLKAISGCDYVISALNISRVSDFPWAPLRTPEHYLSDVMNELIPIAEEQQCRHVTICSAWGVYKTKSDIPKWFRWLIDHSNIGAAYKDHERQEKLLSKSFLNWTIVRPVGLTNSKKPQKIRESLGGFPLPNLLISRRSVAKYLVQTLTDSALLHQRVTISKK